MTLGRQFLLNLEKWARAEIAWFYSWPLMGRVLFGVIVGPIWIASWMRMGVALMDYGEMSLGIAVTMMGGASLALLAIALLEWGPNGDG